MTLSYVLVPYVPVFFEADGLGSFELTVMSHTVIFLNLNPQFLPSNSFFYSTVFIMNCEFTVQYENIDHMLSLVTFLKC